MPNNEPFIKRAPDQRWAPTQSQLDAFNNAQEKLLPPLVHSVRVKIAEWRENNYLGASSTSKALLEHWFETEHQKAGQDTPFQFYFAQREAVESVIYLYEVANYKDKYDLLRLDESGRVSPGMFPENWTRYIVKMATGTGKTKVLGLVLVWSFFHALYEKDSPLSKNFLLIAPNIIVLNRLRKDFEGLKYFFEDPFLPDDGFRNQNWRQDFQLTLHIQDELKPISDHGNIFLTNVHRIFMPEEQEMSFEDMFLGSKPKADADTKRDTDLGKILRSDRIKDLVVLNDEAHHIHDEKLAWFQAIQDINDKLKLKTGKGLALQCDVTATPKHNDGSIFVQTIADYPLVEAIQHGVVKTPVLPDKESRLKVTEKDSDDFVERYRDHLQLGYIEWEKQYQDLNHVGTPLLFVMAMTTKEADAAAEFLEQNYPLMRGKVLSIHTNRSGEIKETGNSKKDKEELERLRKAADEVDAEHSPYRAICSVLMLREGWDVRNVTTIVGLRPFSAKSKILPEQAIGRGLRKMFPLDVDETLVVVGTAAFVNFIEELKDQGVEFKYSPMGQRGGRAQSPLVIEIDTEKTEEELHELDIPLPILQPRVVRDYRRLRELDVEGLNHPIAELQDFPGDTKEIVFNNIHGDFDHITEVEEFTPEWRNVLRFYTGGILKSNRLAHGFDELYPKVEAFVRHRLFGKTVSPEDETVLKNLSTPGVRKIIYDVFQRAITKLTIRDVKTTELRGYRSLMEARPSPKSNQQFVKAKKSVFNLIIGDNDMELAFAGKCEHQFKDVQAFAKNTEGQGGVRFHIEYQNARGSISQFYPDFFVKLTNGIIYVVETKGREDKNDRRKIARLVRWCRDVNRLQQDYRYEPLYITYEDWTKHSDHARSFKDLIDLYQTDTYAHAPEN